MKFYSVALCLVAALAMAVATDSGYFIPKAFYTLDAEGHKSDVHPINSDLAQHLRRVRRQVFSSASSSSAVSTNGGPIFFNTQQIVQQTPEIGTRSGAHTTGRIIATAGQIDSSGKIHYKTQEGHF